MKIKIFAVCSLNDPLSSSKSMNSLWLENNLQTQALLGSMGRVELYSTPSLHISLKHKLASTQDPWGNIGLSLEVLSL